MRILTLSVRFNIVGMIFLIFPFQQYILSLIGNNFAVFFVLRIRQKYYMIVLDKGGLCHE